MDARTLAAYDLHASSFAANWEQAQAAPDDLHAVVRRCFHAAGLTADVGCGSGRDTAWLAENGFPAIGIDPSQSLLEEAARRHPGVRFQRGELPGLGGFADGTFANVLCETVIMHLDPGIIAASVRRLVALLEEDGILYLSWRVTEGSSRRDEQGRLYTAFDRSLVDAALTNARIELDERVVSASSGKAVHRIVARKT
jgi:SAM-dependent methyltransferase